MSATDMMFKDYQLVNNEWELWWLTKAENEEIIRTKRKQLLQKDMPRHGIHGDYTDLERYLGKPGNLVFFGL